MANILQEYTVGESFNTYTQTELSTADWNWDHRTLVGLIDKDGNTYDLGDPIKFDEQEAALCGIWELNKQKLTTISASSNSSGSISVLVHEKNIELPLANNENPYTNVQTFVLNPSDSVSLSAYNQDNKDSNSLSIDIIASEDTILKSINCPEGTYTDIDSKKNYLKYVNGTVWDPKRATMQIFIYPLNASIGYMNMLPNQVLTFEFASSGVLTYYPNTNTLNPKHPSL